MYYLQRGANRRSLTNASCEHMNLDIETTTIQRLRDALLEGGRAAPVDPAAGEAVMSSRERAALARFAPFAEIMCLMMMIDQQEDVAEIDAIRGAMRLLTNDLLGDAALEDIFRRCRADASEFGVESCLQKIGARVSANRQDRETAFSLAAAVALADETLLASESKLMTSIAQWCGVSDQRASVLLDQL